MKLKALRYYKNSYWDDLIEWQYYNIEYWCSSVDGSVAYLPYLVTTTWKQINYFKFQNSYIPYTFFDIKFLFLLNQPMTKIQELKRKNYFTEDKEKEVIEKYKQAEKKIKEINEKIQKLEEQRNIIEEAFANIEFGYEHCDIEKLEKWLSFIK